MDLFRYARVMHILAVKIMLYDAMFARYTSMFEYVRHFVLKMIENMPLGSKLLELGSVRVMKILTSIDVHIF